MKYRWYSILALLLCFSWAPAHAGFLDKIFDSTDSEGSKSNSITNPVSSPIIMLDTPNSSLNVSDYRLGAGDKLSITVFNEKELSMEIRLGDAGGFLYPFLGEVIAKGKTLNELQGILTARLKEGYLVDPKIYVSILEYRPFFVNGEVMKPGAYSYQPGLTVRKAISIAGGLSPRASLSKIYVIHEDDPTNTPRLITFNSALRPGDTITIDQSFF